MGGPSVSWTASTVYVFTTAMAAAYRPTIEQTVMTTAHYGGGTVIPVEITVNTNGTIQARPTISGTLGSAAAHWIAIPPMSWAKA